MSKTFDKLAPYLERAKALEAALVLFEWDSATLAPEESQEQTASIIGVLSDQYFRVLINDEVKSLLSELKTNEEWEQLSELEQSIVKELEKAYEQMEAIPAEEYREYSELKAKASYIWEKAKEEADFSQFAPILEKLIAFNKKFIQYRYDSSKFNHPYDVLLGDFEPGFTVERLDEFFGLMKEKLVPFIKEVLKKAENVDNSYAELSYPIEKQKEFCKFLAEYIGFDFKKGVLAESAHPFTTNLHNKDVRITSHYYENNFESAMFSTIHEGGHGIYEMQVADKLTSTIVGGGSSMGMHESQSRFYENVIGRSESFWKPIYKKMQELYPKQLSNVSIEQFIKGCNKPKASLIRTEADELTYPLHVLIRYEIEKMLFNDEIEVSNLPTVWNEKYKEYLGVTPKNDSEGVLQDIHWSGGSFGYFPSYALGSAVSAQIYFYLKKVMDFEDTLEKGNLETIRRFLGEHIHQYGKTRTTNEVLKAMTGEEFNPEYYIEYLKQKYSKLYL